MPSVMVIILKNLILHSKNRPQAEFTLYPRETSINEPTIYVNNQSLFANYYEWSFGDSTELYYDMDTEHNYESAGNFDIKLFVVNEFGCIDSITKQVIVHPNFELFIPDVLHQMEIESTILLDVKDMV